MDTSTPAAEDTSRDVVRDLVSVVSDLQVGRDQEDFSWGPSGDVLRDLLGLAS